MPALRCAAAKGAEVLRRIAHPEAGAVLVVVLLLVAALALASAASWRLAQGTVKVAAGFRQQALALQAAEAALRRCEAQLLLPEAERLPALQDAAMPLGSAAAPVWAQAARWAPGQSLAWLGEAAGPAPLCLAERQAVEGGEVLVLTARGFSPEWQGDASGKTVRGVAAWVQATVLVQDGRLRERVQRRLLRPPVD